MGAGLEERQFHAVCGTSPGALATSELDALGALFGDPTLGLYGTKHAGRDNGARSGGCGCGGCGG